MYELYDKIIPINECEVFMDYKEVIKKEYIDDYIKYHKKFFYEMCNVNADMIVLEKLFDFPFRDLRLYFEKIFFTIVADNTFQYLAIKIHRLLNDQESDVLTLRKYKGLILRDFLKEEYKSNLNLLTNSVYCDVFI
jgi:hypothetical protein